MITAKNLQLLDTQGNNISPAVNIETIYYEQMVGNVIHRNHIFKHFPVYVKYNGKPAINYTGTILTNDNFYKNYVVPYENKTWPKNAVVTHNPKSTTYNASTGGTVLLKDFTITNNPDNIYVAGIRQTPLGNGTDFMRLDISTYNLTSILEPVAYKDWVNVRLDYYNTKIENNNIYDSELRKTTKLTDLPIYNTVGGLTKKIPFDSLNGLTYTELLDKILLGPVNPKLHDCIINLNISDNSDAKGFIVTDKLIKEYHDKVLSNQASYLYNKISAYFNASIELKIESADIPVLNRPSNSVQLPKIINSILFIDRSNNLPLLNISYDSDNALYVISTKTNTYNIALPWDLYQLRLHLDIKFPNIKIEYPANNIINNKIYNSVGVTIPSITNINDIINDTDAKMYIYTNGIKHIIKFPKIDKPSSTVSNYATIKGDTTLNTMYNLTIRYPIKFGHALNNLNLAYLTSGKFNKIYASWDPVKTFYVCIPRIITSQLINPIPVLYRMFQNSRWQTTNDWTITKATGGSNITNKKTKKLEYLEGYIVYIISPIGVGAKRLIIFSLDMTITNLQGNKNNKIAKRLTK